ncbi:IctB family putative bicarbonate transporter [Synechococcus sp. PCC 7336]|uniref:IctB family putative bicarbonate transporter n=1 Tax=Synechococcus sp. PCC 7336 TaxID=195250 RepID=UPI00034644C2|nr:IctB family putative bicarbonate transporter [Synechococcus sp. PCC 7336]
MAAWTPWMPWQYPALQWWQGSQLGQLAGRFQLWGQVSLLGRWLEPMSVALAALYLMLSAQPSTGPLGLLLLGMAVLVGLQWLLLPPIPSPLHLPIGVYWAVATFAMAFSPVQAQAFEGWLKLTLYLLGFLLLHRTMQNPRYRNWLIAVLLLTSVWVSIYGLRQFFYGAEELATWTDPNSPLAGATRVYSHLNNPNLLAGYLIPIVPIGLIAAWAWSGWGSKLFAVAATGMNAICLVMTLSRGGWIGLLAGITVAALFLVQWNQVLLPQRLQKWALPLLVGVGAIAVVLAILFVEPIRIRVLSMFVGREDSSNNYRINVWTAVVEMIRDFPVLGIGPGNDAFNRVYPLYQRANFSALGAYSVPLELTVETGLVGAAVYLWFLLTIAACGLRRWLQLLADRQPASLWVAAGLSACAGLVVHGLVDTIWYRPQVQMLWWLSVALISSQLVQRPPEPAVGSPSSRSDGA